MQASRPIETDAEILGRIATMAGHMRADDFLDIMYEVAADMVRNGTSIDEVAELCERICNRVGIAPRGRAV